MSCIRETTTVSLQAELWHVPDRDRPCRFLYQLSLGSVIYDRFFSLAVARSMQLNRSVDIMSVREFIGANKSINHILAGRFTAYKKAGATSGEESGKKDEAGYPYKRWRLVDSGKAKTVLDDQRIRPMRASAMTKWQVNS